MPTLDIHKITGRVGAQVGGVDVNDAIDNYDDLPRRLNRVTVAARDAA